jgi:hypothetical protein
MTEHLDYTVLNASMLPLVRSGKSQLQNGILIAKYLRLILLLKYEAHFSSTFAAGSFSSLHRGGSSPA